MGYANYEPIVQWSAHETLNLESGVQISVGSLILHGPVVRICDFHSHGQGSIPCGEELFYNDKTIYNNKFFDAFY